MHLLLVRHGETAWNEALRYQGRSDVPLNGTGRAQARRLADRLAPRKITAIYSSPLSRALETARIIAEPHGLPVQATPDLREMDFGEWEGRTHAELDAVEGDRLAAWWADPVKRSPPGGESLEEVQTRGQAFLTCLQALYREEDTLVAVSHAGPIKAVLFQVLQLNLAWHWQVRIDRASVTTLDLTSRGAILTGCNDTCHLTCMD